MTVTGDNLDSSVLTLLDTQPIQVPSAGEGAPGLLKHLSDYVVATAGITAGSQYRLARFPSNAKVKRAWLYTEGLDSSTGITLDCNIAFSDSAYDGTNTNLQGLIPTTGAGLTGLGVLVAPATYTAANKLFGTATPGATGAVKNQDITYNGTYSAFPHFSPSETMQPMWAVLGGSGVATTQPLNAGGGFAQDSNSVIKDPGGFFDVIVRVTGTPGTAATGIIGIELDYVL